MANRPLQSNKENEAEESIIIRLAAQAIQRQLIDDLLPRVIRDGIDTALLRIAQARVRRCFEAFERARGEGAGAQTQARVAAAESQPPPPPLTVGGKSRLVGNLESSDGKKRVGQLEGAHGGEEGVVDGYGNAHKPDMEKHGDDDDDAHSVEMDLDELENDERPQGKLEAPNSDAEGAIKAQREETNGKAIAEQEPADPPDASPISSPETWSGYLSTDDEQEAKKKAAVSMDDDDDDEEPTLVPVIFGGSLHMEWSNLAPCGKKGGRRWIG